MNLHYRKILENKTVGGNVHLGAEVESIIFVGPAKIEIGGDLIAPNATLVLVGEDLCFLVGGEVNTRHRHVSGLRMTVGWNMNDRPEAVRANLISGC